MWSSLTTKERLARRALLELILTTGRGPSLKALATRLEVSESAAAKLLSALERKRFLVRGQHSNTITAAYPLSTRPTQHRVTLKGTKRRRYALCAIDALGVGPLFGVAVIVNTKCPQCGRSIRIHVEESQIAAVKPAGLVVWDGLLDLLRIQKSNLDLVETH